MSEILQKRCRKCGETKPVEAFVRRSELSDGRSSHCKACTKAHREANADTLRSKQRAYYTANAEAIKAHGRVYYVANRERIRECHRAWHAANAESVNERKRAYRKANPELFRERNRAARKANPDVFLERQRAYCAKNPEKVRQIQRAWYIANVERVRAIRHRRRAHEKKSEGSFTEADIEELYQQQAGCCAYCGQSHTRDELSVDHIIPISRGGRNDRSNLCLACRSCNSSKCDRLLDEWTNRWYLRKK